MVTLLVVFGFIAMFQKSAHHPYVAQLGLNGLHGGSAVHGCAVRVSDVDGLGTDVGIDEIAIGIFPPVWAVDPLVKKSAR